MCILFLAVQQHPDYPLIICANRDEFFDRPTSVSEFWQDSPDILAGRDLKAGGTWMGINRNGRFAALTNVRDPQKIDPDAKSRGALVTEFLQSQVSNQTYLDQLRSTKDDFNGYNLIFGDWQSLWVYNNHLDETHALDPGFHGLSNANLNSPWPKVNRGVTALREYCQNQPTPQSDQLFSLLKDQTQAADDILPQTGVPIEWERRLSSIFIESQDYGTRACTLLLVDKDHHLSWTERSFGADARQFDERNFQFDLK